MRTVEQIKRDLAKVESELSYLHLKRERLQKELEAVRNSI